MLAFVIKLAIRVAVFGIALAFASRTVANVTVRPKSALPLVALVFAVMNTLLYGLLATTVKVVSLWLLALVAPFIANAVLLWVMDRFMKPIKIDGLWALAGTSLIVTIAHFILRIAHL